MLLYYFSILHCITRILHTLICNVIYILMSNNWINYVKQVAKKYGISYRDALKLASEIRKNRGGMILNLSDDEKEAYERDTKSGENLIVKNGTVFWDVDAYRKRKNK